MPLSSWESLWFLVNAVEFEKFCVTCSVFSWLFWVLFEVCVWFSISAHGFLFKHEVHRSKVVTETTETIVYVSTFPSVFVPAVPTTEADGFSGALEELSSVSPTIFPVEPAVEAAVEGLTVPDCVEIDLSSFVCRGVGDFKWCYSVDLQQCVEVRMAEKPKSVLVRLGGRSSLELCSSFVNYIQCE